MAAPYRAAVRSAFACLCTCACRGAAVVSGACRAGGGDLGAAECSARGGACAARSGQGSAAQDRGAAAQRCMPGRGCCGRRGRRGAGRQTGQSAPALRLAGAARRSLPGAGGAGDGSGVPEPRSFVPAAQGYAARCRPARCAADSGRADPLAVSAARPVGPGAGCGLRFRTGLRHGAAGAGTVHVPMVGRAAGNSFCRARQCRRLQPRAGSGRAWAGLGGAGS